MRCPTCRFDLKSHSVVALNAPAVLHHFPVEESWDVSAQHHVHDPTVKIGFFRCSNGHEWKYTHMARCPSETCDWNWKPEIRGQFHVLIPGRSETIADFRCRKLSQFARMKERLPSLYLQNSRTFWQWFEAVDWANKAQLVFGDFNEQGPDLGFIDIDEREAMIFFNGGRDGEDQK